MGVAPTKPVTRCRSIRSSTRRASNRSRRTTSTPDMRFLVDREAVRVVERRRYQHPLRLRQRPVRLHGRGRRRALDVQPGALHQDDLRGARRPRATDPPPPRGRHLGKRTGRGRRRLLEEVRLPGVDDQTGTDDRQHPVALPIGEVPPHRDDHRSDLPSGEGRNEVLGRVPQADRHEVPDHQPPRHEHPGQLGRPPVELAERDAALAAVLGREENGETVGVRLGDPVELGPEGNAGGHGLHEDRGSPRPRWAMMFRWISLVPP